jgi:hypothetical protein
MAKTLLEFEDELINVYEIKTARKTHSWSNKQNKSTFNIEVNKEYVDATPPIPVYKFEYITEKQRDDQWELFKLQISDLESIDII